MPYFAFRRFPYFIAIIPLIQQRGVRSESLQLQKQANELTAS